MAALDVVAFGALQARNDYTCAYIVEGLRCDLWDRVRLRFDRYFFHGDVALGTQTLGLFHAQPYAPASTALARLSHSARDWDDQARFISWARRAHRVAGSEGAALDWVG
jgi:hypothetical protein